ncbi:hypothetical protein PGTUg99_050147 [Puccinia graminis f. sp. tritici]|uniref:Uncharacterized protein n=1 Tax=Puccinia graminis f. sp. tritici TaxID=56615 RepID=A0A5B0RGU5_PUCGR|nr:hypothetical protein PGTUg99_050147 [Puccinia graminis f. sp. tritici]
MSDPSIMSTNPRGSLPITSTPNSTTNEQTRPSTSNHDRDQPPHTAGPIDGTTATETRDQRRTHNPDERAARLQQVEIDHLAASLISSACSHIDDADLLAADGANFSAWEDFLEERMRGATGAVSFFNRPARNLLHERVGRALLVNTIHRSLRRGVSRLSSAHAMWNDLFARFHSVSRAAQLNLFRRLVSFNVADHATTAQMSTHINDILDEMTDARMLFTREYLAGLVLQNGLHSEPALQEEFNRQVEIDFQSATTERPAMSFEAMVRLIDIIRRQHQFQANNRDGQRSTPLIMQAEAQQPDPTPSDIQHELPQLPVHPDNVPDAHDFMAMQAGLCWQCRSPEHLLRDSPFRARPMSSRNRFRNQPQQQRPQARHGPGFQSFYPIVTPPGFGAIYPQTQPPPPPNARYTQQQSKPAKPRPSQTSRLLPTTSVQAPTGERATGVHRVAKGKTLGQ